MTDQKKEKRVKLSAAQERVMSYLGHGWTAYPMYGSALSINGQRACNVDTMAALARMGLVVMDADRCWDATQFGKQVTQDLNLGYDKSRSNLQPRKYVGVSQ